MLPMMLQVMARVMPMPSARRMIQPWGLITRISWSRRSGDESFSRDCSLKI